MFMMSIGSSPNSHAIRRSGLNVEAIPFLPQLLRPRRAVRIETWPRPAAFFFGVLTSPLFQLNIRPFVVKGAPTGASNRELR
jgi:hypothetical protein